MTDQNEALPAEGSDAHQQGEQSTNNNNQTMESLLKEQDLNVDLPQSGEIRVGMIASISPSQILVSIGAKSEGVVSGRELEQLTAEERDALKVGQEVHVYVINPEDANGNVIGQHRSNGVGRPKFWERARYYGEEKRLAAALDAAEKAAA